MILKNLILLALFTSFASGCSTTATLIGGSGTQSFNCRGENIPRVYSGVVNDWRFVTSDDEGGGLAIIDLPLSFIGDTLVLPYTAYRQAKDGDLCEKKPK